MLIVNLILSAGFRSAKVSVKGRLLFWSTMAAKDGNFYSASPFFFTFSTFITTKIIIIIAWFAWSTKSRSISTLRAPLLSPPSTEGNEQPVPSPLTMVPTPSDPSKKNSAEIDKKRPVQAVLKKIKEVSSTLLSHFTVSASLSACWKFGITWGRSGEWACWVCFWFDQAVKNKLYYGA